jgi:lipopolysaccharide export system permease protein
MIKLYHRYVFKSVLFGSIAGVSLFAFILITGNAMRDIISELAAGRIDVSLFFQLIGLLVPYTISFAFPLGILIAVLLVLGRMSAHNEVTALKSGGVSIWHLSAPILLISLMAVCVCFFINNFYAPVAKNKYRQTVRDLVRYNPLRFIVPQSFIHDFPGYVIYADEKQGESLINLWIWELGPNKQAVRLMRAREGRFEYGNEEDALFLTLRNGFSEMRSEKNPDDLQTIRPTLNFDSTSLKLSLENMLGKKAAGNAKVSAMDLPTLMRMNKELSAAIDGLSVFADFTPSDALHIQKTELEKKRSAVRYYTQRNIAMAFSVLALALLGIPMGIKASRTETYANIGIALILAMIYYVFLVIIDWQAENPNVRADILIWLPNLAFQSLGIYLIHRSNRH